MNDQTPKADRPQVWVEDAKRRGEAIMKEAQEKEHKPQRGHDRPPPSRNEAARWGDPYV